MTFKSIDRDTQFLFPPSVQDWLPEGHLARFVVDVVGQLDLGPLNAQYKPNGEAAYPPSMLLSLMFYGYATGTFSSRALERKTYEGIDFRYIAANSHPDHSTISEFRKRFLKELSPLFLQVLTIASESGLLKLGTVSLDGTKMKANASKHKPGDKPPSAPSPGPGDKDQVNFTDPESRIMPKSGGSFEQCYNAQASVDGDSRMIVGRHISQSANDKKELEPALSELEKVPQSAGQVKKLNADNGYYSETNVEACEKAEMEPHIAMGREKHNRDFYGKVFALWTGTGRGGAARWKEWLIECGQRKGGEHTAFGSRWWSRFLA